MTDLPRDELRGLRAADEEAERRLIVSRFRCGEEEASGAASTIPSQLGH